MPASLGFSGASSTNNWAFVMPSTSVKTSSRWRLSERLMPARADSISARTRSVSACNSAASAFTA